MKKLALTVSYQNKTTDNHIIERIEGDSMIELVSRFLLMSHVMAKGIKDDEYQEKLMRDRDEIHDDDIPF